MLLSKNKISWILILFYFCSTISIANASKKNKGQPKTAETEYYPIYKNDFKDRGTRYELPENKDILTAVQNDIGKLIPPEKYPNLHNSLSVVFDNLIKSQERILEGSVAAVNYVHLVETPELNAFVWTEKKTGIRIISNHMFLTTGMIKYMLNGGDIDFEKNESAKKSFVDGISRLAGVMAHELGHPLDKTSSPNSEATFSIEDHYGKEAKQGIEIKADIVGMKILRGANYPPEYLYKSLKYFFKAFHSVEDAVTASSSTHPHKDFRMSSARLYLTIDRIENGNLLNPQQIHIEEQDLDLLKKEIEKINNKKGQFPYSNPTSMEEIVQRLHEIKTKYLGVKFSLLEFNRLVLSFDKMLLERESKGGKLNQNELNQFKSFLHLVYDITSIQPKYGGLYIYDRFEIHNNINQNTGISGLENSPSHFHYLEKLNSYKLPIVLKTLNEISEKDEINSEKRKGNWYYDFVAKLKSLALISSAELFFKVFSVDFKNYIRNNWVQSGNKSMTSGALSEFKEFGLNFQLHFAQLGDQLREGLQKVPFNWHLYRKHLSTHWSPIPLSLSSDEKAENTILKLYRQSLVYARSGKHPEIEAGLKLFRHSFEEVWKLRGFYGTTEILFQNNNIDWNLIFEVLNLDRKVALNQIQSEVNKYMRGERDYSKYEIPPFRIFVLASSNLNPKSFSTAGKTSWLEWNSRSLKNSIYFDTEKSESKTVQEQNQDKEAEVLKNIVEKNREKFYHQYRVKEKSVFDHDYQKAMSNVVDPLESINNNLKKLAVSHLRFIANDYESIISDLRLNYSFEIINWNKTYFLERQLDLLERSKLSIEDKKTWFNSLFLNDSKFNTPEDQKLWMKFIFNMNHGGSVQKEKYNSGVDFLHARPINERVINLHAQLFNTNSIEFFFKIKKMYAGIERNEVDYFQALDYAEDIIQKDLEKIKITEYSVLRRLIELVVPREKIGNTSSVDELGNVIEEVRFNSDRIQKIKKSLINKAMGIKLTKDQKREIFQLITESGPTRAADEFFESFIKLNKMNSKDKKIVSTYLDEGRFSSDKLRLDLALIYIGERVDDLALELERTKKPIDRYRLKNLIDDLNRYTPNGSLAKDAFIESIGWKLKLYGSELDGFIDDQKSQNWRKANPMIIRVGSLLANHFSKLDFEARLKMIEYLIDPIKNETTLFNDLVEEFKRITYEEIISKESQINLSNPNKVAQLKLKAEKMAENLKLKAEEAIRDSSPMERIPLLEVVMTSGAEAPIVKDNWPVNVTRPFLHFKKGSVEEVLFLTLLEVLPKHEHSVAMAYMLSLSSDKSNSGVAQLFEVFGTVGIKFAQLVSIWKLLGEKLAEETKHLKSSAKPLERSKVIKLTQTRSYILKELISEFEKVMGAASVKTTVKVKLKNGQSAALSVQGESVPEIIAMNIDLGKKYLELLKQKNVIKSSKFMMNLIEALEEQLASEIDMVSEVEKTKKAKVMLEQFNKEMAKELNGWKIHVASPIEGVIPMSNIALYELVNGVSFEQLNNEQKAEVGTIIVKAKIKLLFKYGWFEPDRHTGNFIINLETKTIHFIDFGQFENFEKYNSPFKYDPRLVLAQFIRAISNMNARDVVHYASLMSKNVESEFIDKETLIKRLDQRFRTFKEQKSADYSSLFNDVIVDIGESNLKYSTRYIFGGLKGLLILFGENYVSPEQFQSIMKTEITELLVKKSPALALDYIGKFFDLKPKEKERGNPSTMPSISCKQLFH